MVKFRTEKVTYRDPQIWNLIPGNIKTDTTQPAITCSKLTIETLEQGVKYVQS